MKTESINDSNRNYISRRTPMKPKNLSRGRPLEYSLCFVALEDFGLYSPSTIVDYCVSHELLDSSPETRLKVRHAISRLMKTRTFPKESDGILLQDCKAPLLGYFGWRFKQALPVQYVDQFGLILGADHIPNYRGLVDFMVPNFVYSINDILAFQIGLGAIMTPELKSRIFVHFKNMIYRQKFPKEGDARIVRPGKDTEIAWLGSRWKESVDSVNSG